MVSTVYSQERELWEDGSEFDLGELGRAAHLVLRLLLNLGRLGLFVRCSLGIRIGLLLDFL